MKSIVTGNAPRAGRHHASGFTLVELMVVVAIVGVIAAFAYPAYRTYVLEAKRVDAQTKLMELATRQERFYADNRSYATTAKATLGYDSATVSSDEGYWQLQVLSGGQGFVIQAIPAGTHVGMDPDCAFMGINARGQRGGGKTKAIMEAFGANPCWGS